MDITALDQLLEQAFRKKCNLVDDSPSFYKLEFPGLFTINEFEEWAEVCKKFLAQYGLKTGATSLYSTACHKCYALQLYKLPFEKFLETLNSLNKDLKLHQAILENSPKKVIEALLNAGADINNSDIEGQTFLHSAVKKGCEEIIHLFLEKGIPINAFNDKGETILHTIAKTDQVTLLEKLLTIPGIEIHAKNNCGNTCLSQMAFLGKQEMMNQLYQVGVNIETVNFHGETPLFSAVYGANLPAVKFFLERGAHVNHQDSNGTTPLILAIILTINLENSSAMLPIVVTLLNFGADVTKTTYADESALQIADKANNADIGKLLIDVLFVKELMTKKPCFLTDELSYYWDISVKKRYNKLGLEKVLENETLVENVEAMVLFFSNEKRVNVADKDKTVNGFMTTPAFSNS